MWFSASQYSFPHYFPPSPLHATTEQPPKEGMALYLFITLFKRPPPTPPFPCSSTSLPNDLVHGDLDLPTLSRPFRYPLFFFPFLFSTSLSMPTPLSKNRQRFFPWFFFSPSGIRLSNLLCKQVLSKSWEAEAFCQPRLPPHPH